MNSEGQTVAEFFSVVQSKLQKKWEGTILLQKDYFVKRAEYEWRPTAAIQKCEEFGHEFYRWEEEKDVPFLISRLRLHYGHCSYHPHDNRLDLGSTPVIILLGNFVNKDVFYSGKLMFKPLPTFSTFDWFDFCVEQRNLFDFA